jgi:hypothetical protein
MITVGLDDPVRFQANAWGLDHAFLHTGKTSSDLSTLRVLAKSRACAPVESSATHGMSSGASLASGHWPPSSAPRGATKKGGSRWQPHRRRSTYAHRSCFSHGAPRGVGTGKHNLARVLRRRGRAPLRRSMAAVPTAIGVPPTLTAATARARRERALRVEEEERAAVNRMETAPPFAVGQARA